MAAKEATAEDDLPSDYAVGDLQVQKLEQMKKPRASRKRFFQKDRRHSSHGQSSNGRVLRNSPRFPRRRSTMGATENENLEEEWKESNYVELWQGAGLDQPNKIHRRHSISDVPAGSIPQAKRSFTKRHSVDGGKVELGEQEMAVLSSSLTLTKAAAVSENETRKSRHTQQRRFSLSGPPSSGFLWGLGRRKKTNNGRRRHSLGFTSWADAHAAEEEQSVQVSSVDSSITGVEKYKGNDGLSVSSRELPSVPSPAPKSATRTFTQRRHSVHNGGTVLGTREHGAQSSHSGVKEETNGKQVRRHTVDNSGPDEEQIVQQSKENVWSPVSWGKLSLSEVMQNYGSRSATYQVSLSKGNGENQSEWGDRVTGGGTKSTSNRSLNVNDLEEKVPYEACLGYSASFDQDLTNSGLLDLESSDEEDEYEDGKSSFMTLFSQNKFPNRKAGRRKSLGPCVFVPRKEKHLDTKRRHSMSGNSPGFPAENASTLALSLLAPFSTPMATNQAVHRRHSMAGPKPDLQDSFFFHPPRGNATKEQYHFFEGSFNSGRLVSRRHSTVGCMPVSSIEAPQGEDASVQISSVASPITSPWGLAESSSSDLGTSDSPSGSPHGSLGSKKGILETVFEPKNLVSGRQSIDCSPTPQTGLTVSSWGKEELSVSGLLAGYSPSPGEGPVLRPSSGRKTLDSSIASFLQDNTPQDGLVDLYSDESSRESADRHDSCDDYENSTHSSDSTVRTRPNSTNHESDCGEDCTDDGNDENGMCKLSSLEDLLKLSASVDLSSVKACTQVLDSNHSSRVVLAAIEKLQSHLASSTDAVWRFVGAYGGVSLLAKTMNRHVISVMVQTKGISLLSLLLQKNTRFASVILRSGAVAATLDSMTKKSRNKELQMLSLAFLVKLFDTLEDAEHQLSLLSMTTPSILKSTQIHARDESLTNMHGLALWKFSETRRGRKLLIDNEAAAIVSFVIVHGCTPLKVSFMTLFQKLVQDHARSHPCYSMTSSKCPFQTQ